jgi:hypothetical protein
MDQEENLREHHYPSCLQPEEKGAHAHCGELSKTDVGNNKNSYSQPPLSLWPRRENFFVAITIIIIQKSPSFCQ